MDFQYENVQFHDNLIRKISYYQSVSRDYYDNEKISISKKLSVSRKTDKYYSSI